MEKVSGIRLEIQQLIFKNVCHRQPVIIFRTRVGPPLNGDAQPALLNTMRKFRNLG